MSAAQEATGTPSAPDVPVYEGWWDVPDGLLTTAQLAELEFPRQPAQAPVGRVWMQDFRGRRNRLLVDLYRPGQCPPTTASAAALQAAAARAAGRVHECEACGCRPERSLDAGQRLCPVCRHIGRLRARQDEARAAQRRAAQQVAAALAEPGTVILHVVTNGMPPTPAGRPRPALSARIRAADTTGRGLLDVTVSLAGPRARHRDPGAVPAAQVAEQVIAVLGGKSLICWNRGEAWMLGQAVPHTWPDHDYATRRPRLVTVEDWSTAWRAQLTVKGDLVPAGHPGTPDRLWLHLTRIATTDTPGDNGTTPA